MSTRKATNMTNRRFSPWLSPALALGAALLVFSMAAPAQAQLAPAPAQCPSEIKANIACPCIARTNVTYKADVTCTNADGIIVGANGITIRLNGFRLQCKGLGYGLSCQGGDSMDAGGPKRETGITINGFNYVTVKGAGAIQGFDTGVLVSGAAARDIDIEKLNITGPDADLGALPTSGSLESPGSRPDTEGILVQGTTWNSDIEISANSVDNHTAGIKLVNAKGVEVRFNFAHDNNGGIGSMPGSLTGDGHGIHLLDSTDNKIANNLIVDNGVNIPDDSGIILDGLSNNNRVNANNVSFSNGDGISVRGGAANNLIDDNQILYNTSSETIPDPNRVFFDLAVRTGGGVNTFNANNRCETETPGVPATVCNSGEGEPWTKRP
jgi:parallel beta helix pectate lyase-like protein